MNNSTDNFTYSAVAGPGGLTKVINLGTSKNPEIKSYAGGFFQVVQELKGGTSTSCVRLFNLGLNQWIQLPTALLALMVQKIK